MKRVNFNYYNKKFLNQKYLYHFTSYEKFIKIVDSQMLRASRLDNFNESDPNEAKSLEYFNENKVFVSCFTNRLNVNFFKKTENKKIKNYNPKDTVILKFNNKSIWYNYICDENHNLYKKKKTLKMIAK